jgi:hypothetical protein
VVAAADLRKERGALADGSRQRLGEESFFSIGG